MYQIQGGQQKFEPILDPAQIGVFDASKSYYVIFSQSGSDSVDKNSALAREKHAIYVWIGEDQTSLNVMKALGKMQETEFKGVQIEVDVSSSSESVNIGPKMKRNMKDIKIQKILTPNMNLKSAQKDQIDKVKVANMSSLIDNSSRVVNLRTITTMDNEPMHFLQAL